MVSLELMHYDVVSSQLSYKKPEQESMEVESTYKFTVEYSEKNEQCVAHLKQSLRERGEDPAVSIEVGIDGFFSCSGVNTSEDQKIAHILAYRRLFPYVQSKIFQLATTVGMPPILVPEDNTMTPERINQALL